MERLQKYLARSGVASRRRAEDLIIAGRVRVNGEVVDLLGSSIEPSRDRIEVDGRLIVPEPAHVYLAVHKPRGVVSTASDAHGRQTVVGLVPSDRRLFPVGRLDIDSEGLLILTDDGDLAMRLTHPRHGVEKEYHALVRPPLQDDALAALRAGVVLDARPTAPAVVDRLRHEGQKVWLRIVLREGRNRQIRRMVDLVGGEVVRLMRTRIGPLGLGSLEPGRWRKLSEQERELLKAAAR